MTLLNTASDGYYNVLIVVYRALISEGSTNKDNLVKMCSDQTDQSKKRLEQTINKWVQLGLFLEEEGVISLVPELDEYLGKRKKLEQATECLPLIVRRIVFKEENNGRFWEIKKSKAADFSRALSWILAQNIYEFNLGDIKAANAIESQQITDQNFHVTGNTVPFGGLQTWAEFLGFTWRSKTTMVDPTRAIREDLPLVFRSEKELTAEAFISRLAVILPVLDGGKYRKMLEKKLDPVKWQKPNRAEILSTSLSRALWRLESLGQIKLESRSDAVDHRELQRSEGRPLKSFTHVRIGRGK